MPGGLEGRRYQYLARKSHASIARLRAVAGLGPEDEAAPGGADGGGLPQPPAAPRAAAPTAAATESGPLLVEGRAAPAPSPTSPLCDGCMILASVHDALAPPAGVKRLHAALPGSGLLWFEAGHWPNLARECAAPFASAASTFLADKPTPPALLEASAAAAERIRAPGSGGSIPCLDACAIL